MILELHHQGLSVSTIARRTGLDRGRVRQYVSRGVEPAAGSSVSEGTSATGHSAAEVAGEIWTGR